MSEKSFRAEVVQLQPGDSSKEYVAEVLRPVSVHDKAESFSVSVFRTRAGTYKLQWERNGSPVNVMTDVLGNKVHLANRVRFKNIAFLTSGPGTSEYNVDDAGMRTIDILVKFIDDLKKIGIFIKI